MITINWTAEILDTIVSLSGKYGRWLNARGNRICFIIWAICTIYWAVRDFKLGLYSQAIFCIFSVILNLYGYFYWKAIGICQDKNKKIAVTKKRKCKRTSFNKRNIFTGSFNR